MNSKPASSTSRINEQLYTSILKYDRLRAVVRGIYNSIVKVVSNPTSLRWQERDPATPTRFCCSCVYVWAGAGVTSSPLMRARGSPVTSVKDVNRGVKTKLERIGCAHSLFTAPQYSKACACGASKERRDVGRMVLDQQKQARARRVGAIPDYS